MGSRIGHIIGESFETDLDRSHEWYKRTGVALIERLPVPTEKAPSKYASDLAKRLGVSAALRILSRKSRFDYYGVFGMSAGTEESPSKWLGRSIYMEAKATATAKTSLPIVPEGKKASGLQEHQLAAVVESVRRFGAAATVVWRNGRDVGVLPPDALLEASSEFSGGGRRSIHWSKFVEVPFAVDDMGRQVSDWLRPVREWLLESGR